LSTAACATKVTIRLAGSSLRQPDPIPLTQR
jgi:hypothetical protein